MTRSGWIKVGNKYLKKKTIKDLKQLHGKIGATLAISDTYGIDEKSVAKAIKKVK